MTTAYHPQTNGLAKRFNKTLADILAMYVDVEQKTWDRILPFVTFAYNSARQLVGRSEKLLKKYFGRYQVLRKLSDVTYEVHDFDPTSRRCKSKDIVHVLRMKPYYDPDLQAHFNDSVASDDRRFGESTPSTGRNEYTGPTTRSRSKALRQTR
ncbi:transposon Ty3-I Gag-Pol polyprotein [Trichonephila inaurata madagascariensis]|uniref:Transposon Ty3-I Gag-Pol polyprotein n=1 Tax=Trichonephila inaurata madagascariensis TaxID=2747483 RepID=A0A8X7BXG1_9ARAC|nr:transposon Ty3-I Gag-Pol polyprotein [Trichonephila inaurata madagascariensis]